MCHSGGPWRCSDRHGYIGNSRGRRIAQVVGGPVLQGQDHSNALLIAAAPEMLEMLVEIKELTERVAPEVSERAAELIRKAKGEF